MKKFKKLLSSLLVLTMLAGFALLPAYAAEEFEVFYDMENYITVSDAGGRDIPSPTSGSGITIEFNGVPNTAFLTKSGTDDTYFAFCFPGPEVGPTSYSRGVVYRLPETMNNTVFCMQGDFLSADADNIASLIKPDSGAEIYLKNGNIYLEDQKIGEAAVNEWFNVGAVYTLSDTSGSKLDVYINGKLVVSDYEQPTMTGGISKFSTLIGSTASGKIGGKFMYYDNMLFTTDVSKITGIFKTYSTYPNNNATNVAVSSPVIINLNHPVDKNAFSGDMINITPSIEKTTSISDDGCKITLIPAENFAPSTTYTVSVSNSLTDKYGNTYSGEGFSFTTSESIGGFAVVETIPESGANAVNVRETDKVSVTFNTPVDPETISAAVSVVPETACTLSLNETNTELYINPKNGFEGWTDYTITLNSAVLKSSLGDSMSEDKVITFKTGRGFLKWKEDFNSESLLGTKPAGFSGGEVVAGSEDDDGNIVKISASKTSKMFFSILEKDENGAMTAQEQQNKTFYAKYRVKFENAGAATTLSGIRGLGGQNPFWNEHLYAETRDNALKLTQKQKSKRTTETNILFENGKWYEVGYKVVMDGKNAYSGSFYLDGAELGALGSDKGNTYCDIFYGEPVQADDSQPVVMYIDDIEMGETPDILKPDLKLLSSVPANYEIYAPVSEGIRLNFNTAVDAATVTDAISLRNVSADYAEVEISDMLLSEDNTVLTIIPKDVLKYGNDYELSIDKMIIKSTYGKSMKGESDIVFSTKERPEFSAAAKFYSIIDGEKTEISEMVQGTISAETTVSGPVGIKGIIVFAHKRNGKVINTVVSPDFVLSKESLDAPCTAVFENCLATDAIEIFVWNTLEELKPVCEKIVFPQ